MLLMREQIIFSLVMYDKGDIVWVWVFSGGIPPPIYFGALIDQTCLKWGTKQCGGVGACRLYDSDAFRYSKTIPSFSSFLF